MRSLLLSLLHLAVVTAKLCGPGGVRAVMAENLLLKQQLIVLRRARKRAPNLRPSDRLLCGLWSIFLSQARLRKAAIAFQPSTLLAFHQALVRRKYRRLFSSMSRLRKPGPKGPSEALIQAILELKSRNPRFGCPRIALIISQTFGVDIDKNIVHRVLTKHYRPAPGGTGIPFETYRPLDSNRRRVPPALLARAQRVLDQHRRATELFTLDALADEFAIHPRTLRAAARDGRLRVQFSTRSVFGRAVRLASRAATDEFVHLHYRRRYSRYATPLPRPKVTVVPANFASRLIGLRLRLRLTQAELALRLGAANKSVIYQWETRRRTPSVLFWVRVEHLAQTLSSASPYQTPISA